MAEPGESMTVYAKQLDTSVRGVASTDDATETGRATAHDRRPEPYALLPDPGVVGGGVQAASNAGAGAPAKCAATERSKKSSTSRPRLRRVCATVMTRSTKRSPRSLCEPKH